MSFFCVLHTCPSQPATHYSFRRFHFRPYHSSWKAEPCGYARFQSFRRPSFGTPLPLLSFRTLLSHFPDAPHARRCIASCMLLSFPADGRKRCPAHTGRRWHASRSIHDRGVREALRGLTGCRLFQERSGGTTGLSFVSGNCGAPGFRSVWEAPRNFSFVSWNVSTHAVHAAAHCFRGVRGAPLTFPLYRVTSAPVLEASGRRLGGARMSNVLEAFKRHHGFFLCISELQCSWFQKRWGRRQGGVPSCCGNTHRHTASTSPRQDRCPPDQGSLAASGAQRSVRMREPWTHPGSV